MKCKFLFSLFCLFALYACDGSATSADAPKLNKHKPNTLYITYTHPSTNRVSVTLCGDFNQWSCSDTNAALSNISNSTYSIEYPLSPGIYNLKLAVNGKFIKDIQSTDIKYFPKILGFAPDGNDGTLCVVEIFSSNQE